LQHVAGRAARPSFFVFWAGVLLLAASLIPTEIYFWWAGLALLLVPLFTLRRQPLPINALGAALALFCTLLLADAAFLTSRYVAQELYRPMILIAGFAAVATLRAEEFEKLLRAGTALQSLLVLFGLLQVLAGFWPYGLDPARAAATFSTPNTFATAINLFLLPMIALALCGRGGRLSHAAAFWLFAGLLSTQSRGGWVAFMVGVLFIVNYIGLPKTRKDQTRWLGLAAGLAATALAYYALKSLPGERSMVGLVTADVVERGTSYRIDLAAVTLGLIAERPVSGAGAGTFWPLYEMAKPPALDIGVTFPFAHNDYLQTWLEFGLAGIVLLGAVIVAGLAMIRKARRARPDDPVPLACGAALAGLFAHALVDYPLYVPFTVMVLGAWLGALAAHGGDAPWAANLRASFGEPLRPLRTPLMAAVTAVALMAWLAQPVAGYFAAHHALQQLFSARVDEALYWQTVARRMEPRSGVRYWEEGVIWRDQALEGGDRSLAAQADALFAAGTRVDPYNPNNFLERARLHRLHSELFERPASAEAILEWSERAVKLRPYMLLTRAEYARALARAGRTDEARSLAQGLASQYPESLFVRQLVEEL
jgi:O-antigen ligase